MSFSTEWDRRYAENTHLSVWPWSDLVSLVRRHCKQLGPGSRVLELGCGAGANIPFFLALGVRYHAIDGSPTIVRQLHARFPELAQSIAVGDFTNVQPFESGFDLVVDRAALTHNCTASIASGLDLVCSALAPEGHFIGIDWFSTNHSEFKRGEPDADAYTRTNYQDGQFAGTGRVHFSDADHLRSLFVNFELLYLEEKRLQRVVPQDDFRFAAWNLVARRKD